MANASFTKVESLAGSLTDLHVADGRIANLETTTLTLENLVEPNAFPGLGTLYTVIGYAPTSFSTLASSGVVYLNNASGQAAATAVTDSQLLVLPTGAKVLSAVVTNNGTSVTNTGASTYDVSTEVWPAVAGGGNVAAAMTLATVNTGGAVGPVAATALGTSGVAFAPLAAAAANTGLTVQVNVGDNTAGDLAVTVKYLL